MLDRTRMAINLATTRGQWDFPQALCAITRHGIRTVGLWRDELRDYGIAPAAKLLAELDVHVSSLSFGGLFTDSDRQATFDDNRRAIDEAQRIGAHCLIVIAGGLPPDCKALRAARQMVEDGLAELLPYARTAGVALALETLHP